MKITAKKVEQNGIVYWHIKHSKYKYMLAKNYSIKTNLKPYREKIKIENKYFELTQNGKLTIKKYYAWDGASGPTFDTDNSMRPALIHDVMYQMLRMNLVAKATTYKNSIMNTREYADNFFYDNLREDGMNIVRAKYWWLGVRIFGGIVNKFS